MLKKSKCVYDPTSYVLYFSAMYSYSVSFVGLFQRCTHIVCFIAAGKMASGSGKGNDGGVTMEQLKEVQYELERNRMIEENEKRLAVVRQKVHFCGNISKMRNG